jgi:putative tryptophan/tyrosine transport system substrate-binding protein
VIGLLLLSGLDLALGLAEALETGRVYRIGYLNPAGVSLAPLRLQPLREGLRELGYVEGRNLVIEARWAEGNFQRLPELAADLVRLKMDVIVTAATPAAVAAKQATSTIPIVMVDPGDPVATKLVATLAHPGGNITGLSSATPDIAAKHLELLKEALPRVSHVAFLWNAATPAGDLALAEMQAVAPRLGIDLRPISVKSVDELHAAVEAWPRNIGGVIVFTDPLTFTHRQRIVDGAMKAKLPVLSGGKEFADAGALLSYGPSFPEMFRSAAGYVDKILKGARPADLPVEQPTRFQLVVNLQSARALGVTIPPSLRLRADQIIE